MREKYFDSKGSRMKPRGKLGLKHFTTLVMSIVILLIGMQHAYAQKTRKFPGETIVCPARPDDMFTQVNIPKKHLEIFSAALKMLPRQNLPIWVRVFLHLPVLLIM